MSSTSRVLGGRYQLGPTLGRGGMAEVYRAADLRLQRDVAVKQLRVDLASDPTFQARFRREAHSAAGLNHPNIVAVYDTDEESDPNTGEVIPYIVMEIVEGKTLRQVMSGGDAFTPERALEITYGVLDALGYSHRAGIIHRDIKPGNVMLTDADGQVKVMDFGIARAVADTQATMTATAAVIGTAQYLSPEQARGEQVDYRSDLYSTGCLLYELLTGRPPFVGDSPVSVAYQHVRETPVAPSTMVDSISPEVDAVVLKALRKDPADRYQDAREFADDIARLLNGQRPLAADDEDTAQRAAIAGTAAAGAATATMQMPQGHRSPVPPHDPAPQRAVAPIPLEEEEDEEPRSRRGWWIALAALVLVALALGAFALVNSRGQDVEVPEVIGMTESEAVGELAGLGLESEVHHVAGPDDVTVDTVTQQSPTNGTEVATGSTVSLTVNTGPQQLEVPGDLVGKQVEDVEKILTDAGFSNISTQSEESPGEPGEVLSVNPASGTRMQGDERLTVRYVSSTVALPDWSGFNRASVESAARDLGLTNVTFQEQDSSAPAGTVIGQDPTPGTSVEHDAEITVTLAREAQPTPEPTQDPDPSTDPDPSNPGTDPSSDPSGEPSNPGGDPSNPGGDPSDPGAGPSTDPGDGGGPGNGGTEGGTGPGDDEGQGDDG